MECMGASLRVVADVIEYTTPLPIGLIIVVSVIRGVFRLSFTFHFLLSEVSWSSTSSSSASLSSA
jgi:hypothetical protein